MSTLRTNTIESLTGKRLLGTTGSILQVVASDTTASSGEITTTSTTYVSTGVSISITPISASSKLLVVFIGNGKFIGGSGDDGSAYRIYRDGTALNPSRAGDQLFYRSDSNTNNIHFPLPIMHYIDAGSTNTTTFTLFFSNQWGGTAVISRDWGVNEFVVMEISG